MTEFALGGELAVRLVFFFGVLAAMAAWEVVAPRRALSQSKAVRWYGNLGIVALNALVARAVLPLAPVAVAGLAAERGWGVLNLVEVPAWLAVVVALVVLDFAIYLQHVLFHAVPALWRLHRMHHADLDFDVSTGLRFHTIEILLSALIKMAVVVVVGAPALAVLAFEVVLNATSMFNHGNVRLPAALDGALRWLVVTPDMHRVHHSIVAEETNSNFGFSLPWWDRLLGTYRAQPAAGHQGMTIGIEMFRDPGALHLHRMLVQPFQGGAGSYPINRASGPPAT
ncbi:MAG: sterol desaturase family protein [Rhodospirillales bacterium]|jgi:sterol desaturase/sphingolipid hydroxylase (fatty acid hydroxylase superfamily)|nr:sterol desaturase family protein [Rhodospirillales bacterium]MDP6773738.1 sterol desaturase family protein [Rhodospirillales bacterium]